MSDKETRDVTLLSDRTELPDAPAPHFGRAIGFVAGGIGDQIYHLGQLRALAAACQTGSIDIACIHPGAISRILAATPWVGRIIDSRPLRRYVPGLRGSETVRALRLHRYDTGFFMHRSTSFKLAALAAGIPNRIGLADGMVDNVLLQRPLSLAGGGARRDVWGHRPFIAAIDEYITDAGLDLAPAIPTILPDRDAMTLARRMIDGLSGPVSVVNLFALDDKRRWPVAAAIKTISQLAETGGSFILNAGPDAADMHRDALSAWKDVCKANSRIKPWQLIDSLGPDASMERDVALYHLADRYIGVDSFTANLAMNCNLAAVVLFAKSSDRLAYRSQVEAVIPALEGDLGTISGSDILTAAAQLGAGMAVATGTDQPLPV